MIYTSLVKPILFRFEPETVHDVAIGLGEWMGNHASMRALTRVLYNYRGRDINTTVDGITYRTPFLLSAGFDYNGRLSRILPHIGFGGEEIGSVTAQPCVGNDAPRLMRLPRSKSILVNKGLRNDGVDALIARLQHTPREKEFVIGISIARTNSRDAGRSIEDGIADYKASLEKLVAAAVGDYYTINISCPNAFGGETFTTPELLGSLLRELKTVRHSKPMYVKMPVNLSWNEFEGLLAVIEDEQMHGVVIGNLNKEYDSLLVREEAPAHYKGGLSGKPCESISTELIKKTRERFGNRFTIIAAGGVMSPGTALEKFDAGANLVQLITGLIFEGPGLVRTMGNAYGNRVRYGGEQLQPVS